MKTRNRRLILAGALALAASPAIVKFVGGNAQDATHHSLRMRAITLGADRITIKVDRARCPQVPHAEFLITFDPADPNSADLAALISDIVGEDASFKQSGGRA